MLGFVNKLFISFQLTFFLDHVLLCAELAQKFKFFKIAAWQSDSMKRNFRRFSLLQGHKSVYLPFFLEYWKTKILSFIIPQCIVSYSLNSIYFIRLQLVINERKWMEGSNSGSIYKVPWKKWKRNFLYYAIFLLFFFLLHWLLIVYFAFIHFFSFSWEFSLCILRLIFKFINLFYVPILKGLMSVAIEGWSKLDETNWKLMHFVFL